MYNTQFKVKYHDIKQELLEKIVSSNTEAGAEHGSELYSIDDINDVCYKLYTDELSSVFNAENIFDDKIDSGIEAIVAKMLAENVEFNSCIQDMKSDLKKYNDFKFSKEHLDEDTANCIVNLTLFSKPVFHLMHKCICQHLLEGVIDKYLINELKELLKKNEE
jgi:hypothetical protein